MSTIRNLALRFAYHPAAVRLVLAAFALVALLGPVSAPVNGGGGS